MSTIARRILFLIVILFASFLVLSFSFACFAAFGFLMFFPLFKCEMRRRFDTLFAQALVLYLLLMLDLSLFLAALEGDDFFHRERFVRQQIFVNKQRRPSIRGGVPCLFRCEMGVLPVGELLGFGDLTSETDREDLLKSEIENAVLGDHGLHVDAVSRLEVSSASETVDVIFEGKAYLADIRISEDVGKCLRHADMSQTEEVTAFMGSDLHECGGVMDTPLKTRSCFGVYADDTLSLEIGDGVRDLFFAVNDKHLSIECRNRH